jgi:hypothetical protein
LIVDYGSANQACTLKVPALMPTNEKVRCTSDQKQQMYDFLLDLVPISTRGKEVRRMSMQMGLISVTVVDYEHIAVTESNDAITVTFKSDDCQTAPVQDDSLHRGQPHSRRECAEPGIGSHARKLRDHIQQQQRARALRERQFEPG